jgi:hypothetical protein
MEEDNDNKIKKVNSSENKYMWDKLWKGEMAAKEVYLPTHLAFCNADN